MKYRKMINLLDNLQNKSFKFIAKNRVEINDG